MHSNINYIVSGVERSGTSMLMQMLKAGGVPIAYHKKRKPDKNNPKGYFELEGVINKLMDGTFPLDKYKGKFIKITAYGIRYLPPGKYKIIYIERDMDEVLISMERMIGVEDKERGKTKGAFCKLNRNIKKLIEERSDMEALFLNYNLILSNPYPYLKKICNFVGINKVEKMKRVIDVSLREREKERKREREKERKEGKEGKEGRREKKKKIKTQKRFSEYD